jgi:hypothetical protein
MERWFMRLLHLSGSSFWRTFQNPSPEIHIKGHQEGREIEMSAAELIIQLLKVAIGLAFGAYFV